MNKKDMNGKIVQGKIRFDRESKFEQAIVIVQLTVEDEIKKTWEIDNDLLGYLLYPELPILMTDEPWVWFPVRSVADQNQGE